MTTYCHNCNKDITKKEKKDERFVACSHCNQFTAKGVGKSLPKDTDKIIVVKKKGQLKNKILEMLDNGKSEEEIAKEIPCRLVYVKWIKKNRIYS